jgi:hypothetical protein
MDMSHQKKASIAAVLPPFIVPSHVRRFYIRVWEAAFPGEPWDIVNADEYRDLYDSDVWVWNFATWQKRSSFN